MANTPLEKSIADRLEAEFGHLFEEGTGPNLNIQPLEEPTQLTERESRVKNGQCIVVDGMSVCRRGGVWVVCG